MKTLRALLLILTLMPIALHAQATIPVSGQKVVDNNLKPLTGQLVFTVTDTTDTPITYTPQGGSPTTATFTIPTINGAVQNIGGFPPTIANPATMSPSNTRYRMQVQTTGGGTTYFTFPLVNITQSFFSYDGYAVPAGVTASGIGLPKLPCSPHAQYNNTLTSDPYPWVCSQMQGDSSVYWTQNPSLNPACSRGNNQAIASSLTGALFCIDSSQAFVSSGFVWAGPPAGQHPSQIGLVPLSTLCANGACGASSPTGQQFRISGFTGAGSGPNTALGPTNAFTDVTGNPLTVPGRLTGTITNGNLNSDQYANGGGNNGIANAQASSDCSGGCQINVPATSADTESASPTVSNTHIVDNRGHSQADQFYNPIAAGAAGFNPTGQPSSYGKALFGNWDALTQAPDFSQSQGAKNYYLTFNGPGWDYGSPYPGFSGPAWSVQHGINMTMNDSTPGIGQMFGGQLSKYSIGDSQNFYFYNHCDGGAIASADEGCTGGGIQRLQNATWFHGTAVAGSTHGSQLLKTTFTTGRTQYAIGGTMLDTTHLVGVGTVTGVAAQFSGLAAWSTPVTGVTFAESTAWAQAQSAIPPLANPGNQTPQSDTVNFTVLGGTNAGGFTTGQACLDGEEMYESVQITAVGTLTAGTQSVTFNHFFPNGQVGTSLWQGGPCGDYYVPQRDYLAGWDAPYVVLGAPDTTHLIGRFFQTGGAGNPTNNSKPIPNYYTATTANVPILNLSISGTTVTATYGANNSLQYNGLSGAVVSGCTNSSFNGTTGNITAIGGQVIQWTQSGPSGTSASCLLSFPSLTFNFYLMPGAELKGPCTTAGCTLEPNPVLWNSGDVVENPPNPAFRGYTVTLNDQINTQTPLVGTGGISISTEGDGASGNYALFSWQNNNLMNHYIGDGGKLTGPRLFNVAGVTGSLLVDQFAPIDGSPLFNIGCPISAQGGCNTNIPINLFQVNNGIFSYSYPTQTFNFTNVYSPGQIASPILTTGTQAHGGTGVGMTSANSELNNVIMGVYAVFGNGQLFDNSAILSSKENDTALIYAGAKLPQGNGVLVVGTPGSSTYSYEATSVTQMGEGLPTAAITTNTGNATLSSTNLNALNITPGYGAQFINVYRTAAPAGYTVPSLICANVPIATINTGGCKDTGQAGTVGGPPTVDTSGKVQSPAGVFTTSATVAGQNVCQANGTNCPAPPPIASVGTNGISQPDNSTIVITGGGVESTQGFTGSCAPTTTVTVVKGVITGCS